MQFGSKPKTLHGFCGIADGYYDYNNDQEHDSDDVHFITPYATLSIFSHQYNADFRFTIMIDSL